MFTRFLKSLFPSRGPSQPCPSVTLAEDLSQAGLTFGSWWSRRQARRWCYVDLSQSEVETLKSDRIESVTACLRAAERILTHEFDLLGSGPYTPSDPTRVVRPSGYRPIDWALDPRANLRFPAKFFYRDWRPDVMRPGLADIKFPWELARCQHWAVLGQAHRLTGEAGYAVEIGEELGDFMEANPVGFGVNWICTMDVAIRAVNWLLGLELVKHAPSLTGEFWERACDALYAHGVFIYANLENKYEVTSNHFLSNVVGLYFLCFFFDGLPRALEWKRFCRVSLEQEIVAQVLEDGADYESSIPYHRLVTELFLGATRLSDLNGEPLSGAYRSRLLKMVEFLEGVMRPDGLLPGVGDADDGRLHVLSGYGEWNPQDGRHLLGIAARMFDRDEWLACADEAAMWEAAWWGFDVRGIVARKQPPRAQTRLYPEAGLAVARGDQWFLLITNGRVGTKGFGNHKHNDQLALEYHARGVPLLVDPGSYVYTSDPTSRNLFRSASYHNTLRVDRTEPNEVRPEWLFRLFEQAHPVHDAFDESDAFIEYRGRHIGFRRLPDAVTHERRIRLHKASAALAILDVLWGQGAHVVEWHFHCAPAVQVARLTDGNFVLTAGAKEFVLHVPPGMAGTVSDAWYSPSYGIRVPCRAIDFICDLTLDGRAAWFFGVSEVVGDRSCRIAQAVEQMRAEMQADLDQATVASHG